MTAETDEFPKEREAQETEREEEKLFAKHPFLKKLAQLMGLTTIGTVGMFLINGSYTRSSHELALASDGIISAAEVSASIKDKKGWTENGAEAPTIAGTYENLSQSPPAFYQVIGEKVSEKMGGLARSAGNGLLTILESIYSHVPETPVELMEHALEERTQVKRLVSWHYQELEKGAYAPVVSAIIEAYQETIGTLRAAQPAETIQHDAEKSVLECMLKMRTAAQLVNSSDFADYHARQCSNALAGKKIKESKKNGKKNEGDEYKSCKELAEAVQQEAAFRDDFLRLKKKDRIDDACIEALVPYLPYLAREQLHKALDRIVEQAQGLYGSDRGEVRQQYAKRP